MPEVGKSEARVRAGREERSREQRCGVREEGKKGKGERACVRACVRACGVGSVAGHRWVGRWWFIKQLRRAQ